VSTPQYAGEDVFDCPLPPGAMRVIWCQGCGAVTGIITPSGLNGDPHGHELWHLQQEGRTAP
jgi:hypothetical protein